MNIKTGLPHEENGGTTVALFGIPRHKYISKRKPTIYVDCHIITCEGSHLSETEDKFKDLFNVVLSEGIRKKLHAHARKLARQYCEKNNFIILEDHYEYTQTNNWKGFYFNSTRIS